MDHWSRRQFVHGVGVAGLGLLAECGRLPGQGQPPPNVPTIAGLATTSLIYTCRIDGKPRP